MKLSAAEVKYLECPPDKVQFKKADGKGLFIFVKASGSKLWRYKYTFAKKAQEMSLGAYPQVSLAGARKAHEQARALLTQGINPMVRKREKKVLAMKNSAVFGEVALAWWEKQKTKWSDGNTKKIKGYIDKDLKRLSKVSLDKIDYSTISEIMIAIEAAGNPRKAAPVLSAIRRIFYYAKAKRWIAINPAIGMQLKDLLAPMPRVKPRSAILDVDQLQTLIKDIEKNELGTFCSREALKLIPRIFLRPGEVRLLKWEYVKFERKRIYLPGEVMKRNRDFIVPLSTQVLKQLVALKKTTGYSEFVFPNANDSGVCMSKNVLTNRLRALGYTADIMSAHGFRSTASTLLAEDLGWDSETIDIQLSHLTGTESSRAYNRAIHIRKRTKMMQEWSDFLENLLVG